MPRPSYSSRFYHPTILGEEYSFSLCSFLHSPVTSSLLGPNILLSILFSNKLWVTLSANSNANHSSESPCFILQNSSDIVTVTNYLSNSDNDSCERLILWCIFGRRLHDEMRWPEHDTKCVFYFWFHQWWLARGVPRGWAAMNKARVTVRREYFYISTDSHRRSWRKEKRKWEGSRLVTIRLLQGMQQEGLRYFRYRVERWKTSWGYAAEEWNWSGCLLCCDGIVLRSGWWGGGRVLREKRALRYGAGIPTEDWL